MPFLQHVAAAHVEPGKLNRTITRFWVGATEHAVAESGASDFDALLERVPHLLDKQLPFRHWSREALFSADARVEWVDPDLVPLPF